MSEKNLLDYLIKNKEIYHLWFEYLRENKAYREFCEKVTRENFHLGSNITIKNKYNIRDMYLVWGDIYNVTWETIFIKLINRAVDCIQTKNVATSICSDTNSIVTKIHEYEGYFLHKHGRQPTFNEFREFCEMVEAVDNFPKPSRSLPQKEISSLWKNLEIWRAVKREGLTLDDAIMKVDPEKKVHKGSVLSVYRSWKRDLAYAGKIIENAGRGLFPGPYKT